MFPLGLFKSVVNGRFASAIRRALLSPPVTVVTAVFLYTYIYPLLFFPYMYLYIEVTLVTCYSRNNLRQVTDPVTVGDSR